MTRGSIHAHSKSLSLKLKIDCLTFNGLGFLIAKQCSLLVGLVFKGFKEKLNEELDFEVYSLLKKYDK
jgi:hypothetical protein